MSDLNTTFISDNSPSDLTENMGTDIDRAERVTSVKATVVCNNVHEEELMMIVSKPDLHRENNVRECVWETCYTVPMKPMTSSPSKRRKLHEDKKQEVELESDCSLKLQNHMKQKNVKCENKRRANKKRKKSKHCLPGKVNLDHGSDSCLVVEKASFQACDASRPSAVSSMACAVIEYIEHVAENMTELSAGFDCDHKERTTACNDGVNLLQIAQQSTSACQEDSVVLPDKNISTENSDENKNILNYDIVPEKDCQEKMELLKHETMLNCCELAPSSGDDIGQCGMNYFTEPAVTECVPDSVEENIFAWEEQKSITFKKDKRRRSQRIESRVALNWEQENEKHVCSEPDGLSVLEEHEGCAECTVQCTVNNIPIHVACTSCDLAPSSSDDTVQCRMNYFSERTVTECVPSSVEENNFASEQQNNVTSKKDKRRRSQRIEARLGSNWEQENEKHVHSEPDGLSVHEEHEGCAESTVQGIVNSIVIHVAWFQIL